MRIFKIFWKEYLPFFMLSFFVIGRVLRNSFFYAKEGVGGVWNYISLYFLLLYFLSFFKYFFKEKYPKERILYDIYVIYILVIGFIFQDISNLQDIYILLMTPFFIYIFMYFFKNYKLDLIVTAKMYTFLFYLVTFINLVTFILYKKGIIPFLMVSNVYYSLCLYPFTLIRKKINVVSTFFIFMVLLFSNKRAGLFAFFIGYTLYLLMSKYLKKRYILFFITLIVILFLSKDLLVKETDLEIFKRISITSIVKDKGSGRLDIYKKLIESYSNAPISKKVVGIDRKKIFENTGHDYAHNDFIEVLYTRGVIGFFLFVLIYIRYFIYVKRMKKGNYKYLGTYILIMIINFILSVLSVYFIDYGYSIVGAMSTACILSDFNKRGNKNNV